MTTPFVPVGIARLTAFIDLCHLNTVVDRPVARAAGLAGAMHQLTQHTFYSQDPGYFTHIWPRWWLLQYTGGRMGPPPHRFEGIGPVDRSVFNGALDDAWRFRREHALPA